MLRGILGKSPTSDSQRGNDLTSAKSHMNGKTKPQILRQTALRKDFHLIHIFLLHHRLQSLIGKSAMGII